MTKTWNKFPRLLLAAFAGCWLIPHLGYSQDEAGLSFFFGGAFGTSFSIGNFRDTDIFNPEAGFAKNGRRYDLFAGVPVGKTGQTTLTGVIRYQTFDTEVEDILAALAAENPDLELTGRSENWRVSSFLFGLAHRVDLGTRFSVIPRIGLGPMLVTNPGIRIDAPNATITNKFERSTHTGFGLGYEVGLGLRRDLGKHFSLLPTFTFSGGRVNINDVATSTDQVVVTRDYQPSIQSFNIGLSLGYRFYRRPSISNSLP